METSIRIMMKIGLLIQGKIGQGNKTAVFIADIKLDIW
jgi:hypothetical protein